MATDGQSFASQTPTDSATIVRAITVIMGMVVGLTFLFGFGNVLNLGLRLGVPVWVAPLVAPAVDLSVLGLLLGTRHLALTGASADILRPARRLLIFASVVTLALNVADPLVAGEYGKAAFDAVGPLLLIGWAEVGPGFLRAIGATSSSTEGLRGEFGDKLPGAERREKPEDGTVISVTEQHGGGAQDCGRQKGRKRSLETLLQHARREDAAHRAAHQRPISADTLRARLGIGAGPARRLAKIVRSEFEQSVAEKPMERELIDEIQGAESRLVT